MGVTEGCYGCILSKFVSYITVLRAPGYACEASYIAMFRYDCRSKCFYFQPSCDLVYILCENGLHYSYYYAIVQISVKYYVQLAHNVAGCCRYRKFVMW